MSIKWESRGKFVAHMTVADASELSANLLDPDRLACAKCGDRTKFWITDVRVLDGPSLVAGDINAMVLCEKHGQPLLEALENSQGL